MYTGWLAECGTRIMHYSFILLPALFYCRMILHIWDINNLTASDISAEAAITDPSQLCTLYVCILLCIILLTLKNIVHMHTFLNIFRSYLFLRNPERLNMKRLSSKFMHHLNEQLFIHSRCKLSLQLVRGRRGVDSTEELMPICEFGSRRNNMDQTTQ